MTSQSNLRGTNAAICTYGKMDESSHGGAHGSLNRVAFSATVHCLTGCSIGEVLGMIIGSAPGLGEILFWVSLVLSLVIAGAAAFPVVRWLIARARGRAAPRPSLNIMLATGL